jgi:hypothetical protein
MQTVSATTDLTQQTQSTTNLETEITSEQILTTISTDDNWAASSSYTALCFKISAIVLGIVGTVANGAALFALIFAMQVIEVHFPLFVLKTVISILKCMSYTLGV